jgi:RimJ/RimL family protein N-acetyltransferase
LKGLRLRDARLDDCDAVLGFCKHTWPRYGDFIERVWSDWIKEPRGRFIVAELDKTPVGIAKITDFGGGEFWLEGLRVHRRWRGHGVADDINREVSRTLRRMKPRKVRFCTAVPNRASRHIGQKYGFEVIARFRYYWRKSRKGRPRGETADWRQASRIYDFVAGSEFFRLSSGLVAEGWVFREFNRTLLDRYLRNRQVYVIKRSGEFTGVAIYPLEVNDRAITMGFVEGDQRSIKVLARDCTYLAKAQDMASCSAAVPTRRYASLIEQAGFTRQESVGQVVFEHKGKGFHIPHSRKTR